MDLLFDGAVAIVTGAARGLGRAHALELAGRGAQVLANDLDGAEETVAEILAAGGVAVSHRGDISSPAGGAAVVEAAVAAYGRVDAVVNNAGIVRDAMFHKLTPEALDEVLAVHVAGTVHVTAPAWRLMRGQGFGRVVFTTSASGLFGNPGQANYGAAKAALYGLTRVLALEGKRYGIGVNAVAPAAATRLNAEMLGEKAALLDPAAVAPVVAYLAHRSCELTGQVLSAGGGHVAAVLVGLTAGITDPALTAETVRDSMDRILDPGGMTFPRHIGDDLRALFTALEETR
jgi:NAD(P)-dependent dehydrogenase (short-subunit alcohol dehydrogenase family)